MSRDGMATGDSLWDVHQLGQVGLTRRLRELRVRCLSPGPELERPPFRGYDAACKQKDSHID